MEPLSLRNFTEIVKGELFGAMNKADVVKHVATHSDRIRSGAAFFALQGSRTDGHEFIEAAARNGATVAVIKAEHKGQALSCGIPVIGVHDPLRSLQRLAGWWRRCLDTQFVAIVGSLGKTVTKDCLVHLLSYQQPVYGTPGSYNSQVGVPLAVLECPRSATTAVIEVAVSDPGEMANIAHIVSPNYVVLTNVGTRWRYRFVDRSHQISELLSIAADLPLNGWLLLGQDDDDVQAAAAKLTSAVAIERMSPRVPTFGEAKREPGCMTVNVAFPHHAVVPISVRTLSNEILSNVQLAISSAWLLGVDISAIIRAFEVYTPTSTRMEIWKAPSGVTLVRDIATPDPIAVRSAVRTAKRLTKRGGRTVVVLSSPDSPWENDADLGLAHALVTEGADEIFGLAPSPNLEHTAALIAELDGTIPVRLFDSTEALRGSLIDHLEYGDVCLVQSPPGRPIGDVSISLIEAMAPTRAYLDLTAMEDNVATFRRLVGPSVRIMAMVKALAYGTDSVTLSLALHDSGLDFLGVSSADEGVALRQAGATLPILVMLGTEDEVDKMIRYRLTPLIYSPSMLDAINALSKDFPYSLVVHVEVDTGMHRSGLKPTEAIDALAMLTRLKSVRVEGIMTHFASADDPEEDAFTLAQLAQFDHVLHAAKAMGLDPIVHTAATAGAIRFPSARFNMIRIGLGLFGIYSSPATSRGLALTPVLGLVSRVVQIIEVPAGERVGYGGTHTARKTGERIGVVPAGYADGVPRALSNLGHVIVAGLSCPIVGAVSMDSMTIDLTACPTAAVGSDVLIYGRHGDWDVPLEEVAQAIGTIPYELMIRRGPRIQRILTRH